MKPHAKTKIDVINVDDDDECLTTNKSNKEDNIKEDIINKPGKTENTMNNGNNSYYKNSSDIHGADAELKKPTEESAITTAKNSIQHKTNFYEPLAEDSESVIHNHIIENKDVKYSEIETRNECHSKTENIDSKVSITTSDDDIYNIERELEKMENPTGIPLFNEPTIHATSTHNTVSEIDILRILENEIQSESITIPEAEASASLLHQPKVNKVESAKEILPQKRISIEKHKQKSIKASKILLDEHDFSKEDLIKKASLKLTNRECESFNFPKLSFDGDSSGRNDGIEIEGSELAIKLTDHNECSNTEFINDELKTSHLKKDFSKYDTGKLRNNDSKSKRNENIARSSKEVHDAKYRAEKYVKNNKKSAYSSGKNNIRMRRENDAEKSEIVVKYSNEKNIKGVILTSGYGVKNYRIPKIKRVIDEKEVERYKKEEHDHKKQEKETIDSKHSHKIKFHETAKEKMYDTKKEKPKDVISKEKGKEIYRDKNKEIPKDKDVKSGLKTGLEKQVKKHSERKTKQPEETKDENSDKPINKDKILNDHLTTKKLEITDIREILLNKDDEKEIFLNKNDEKTTTDKDENENFIGDESYEKVDADLTVLKTQTTQLQTTQLKSKFINEGKGCRKKTITTTSDERITRATAVVETKRKPKKPTHELQKLHADFKEMFTKDDIMSDTGIKMCRLEKMVKEKSTNKDVVVPEVEPVVVIEKFKNSDKDSLPTTRKAGKKPKQKTNKTVENHPQVDKPIKDKPGPKFETKNKRESDLYAFETESVEDTHTEKKSYDDSDDSSDSDMGSLASLRSFGSSEILADLKKSTKRKRRSWQDEIIKPNHKKKKVESKLESTAESLEHNVETETQIFVPDMNCFTDKKYCFRKSVSVYSCRLCIFSGKDIVHHYKNEHPHVEIPLSRMAPAIAKEAIKQCKKINFSAVTKISSEKYVCIFCYKEFHSSNSVLETFFWHVVTIHTGEYKLNCSECVNENRCPLSLDIPPPPRNVKGQLIGYICKKCNFTQLSLENLKTHVIVRHGDEQIAVYTISLASMSKKTLKYFLRRCKVLERPTVHFNSPRIQEVTSKRLSGETNVVSDISCRLSISETSLRQREKKTTSLTTKITFKADDNVSKFSDITKETPNKSTIEIDQIDSENTDEMLRDEPLSIVTEELVKTKEIENQPLLYAEEQGSSNTFGLEDLAGEKSSDITESIPHFKIKITKTGSKEYICCINGNDNHFKSTLLISMKKHVQLKHSENWDGYCLICKVIVTPQGVHHFKDCFQHFVDKHMDNFPMLEVSESTLKEKPVKVTPIENTSPKTYNNVRPISELISSEVDSTPKESSAFPIIQSVVSIGAQTLEAPRPSPIYPLVREATNPSVTFKYEEVQAKVMSNKHRVVLETMMTRDKLIELYKCAGRFCSFTSDSALDALLHASTHQKKGGIDALNCSYCDFDAMGNGVDLVIHVFKVYGKCQYSCTQCFYRAAASQSVGAHMRRVHPDKAGGTVLRATTVADTFQQTNIQMLTREQAVPCFVCNHGEGSSYCKFRTYTAVEFCEHLQQMHSAAASHPCYMCQMEVTVPSDLCQHMMTHGLKLYQCTWCVFGADNENELLEHISILHPTNQPQAYLRIITNEEGTNELPLVFLKKLKTLIEDVPPSKTKENPVREAERSIDLEKLIQLSMMMEPQDQPIKPSSRAAESNENLIPNSITEPVAPVQIETFAVAEIPNQGTVSKITRPRLTDEHSILERPPVPDQTPVPDPPVVPQTLLEEIIVLDGDEEEPKQSVIDLSDEDSSSSFGKNKKVPNDILGKCPKCQHVWTSNSGLKKHLSYCYPNKDQGYKCAHCPYLASNGENILIHCMDEHSHKNIYQCGACPLNQLSLNMVKRHIKFFHKKKDLIVSSSSENELYCVTVNVAPKTKRELPQSKLSATNRNTHTLPKRRILPQEVNQLSIYSNLDQLVYCAICEFNTKDRLTMVRHLFLHAPVSQTAPVNTVPQLKSNEKHFDEMLNLASSSIVSRTPEKPLAEKGPFVPVQMSPELAARYPKQISARERNTCVGVGCSYTSVDEQMLKHHWKALHSASFNFSCVHCPSTQTIDTSKQIAAKCVTAHLKMHDDTLYACSKCDLYHFKIDILKKHLTEVHPDGQLMVVRENASVTAAVATPIAPPSSGQTTDSKPWQCGLCKFKSMLRAEVAAHCFKLHQSKMQFQCGYCLYRASAIDKINIHLAHSHANEPEEVMYYYYPEGSLPDEADGTPRWMKQCQKLEEDMLALSEVKNNEQESSVPSLEDAEANSSSFQSLEDFCKKFGDFCEPNGISFKCPLCKVVTEHIREAMESHLYEELKYKKWSSDLCGYKAFQNADLVEQMTSKSCRQYAHIELPTDANIEKWVKGQLDHQAAIIDKYKRNLAKQKINIGSTSLKLSKPSPSVVATPVIEAADKYSVTDLVEAFGEFGVPSNMMYCCPKCGILNKDETTMRDHLETELNKIRPREAVRDPSMRAAWVTNIMQAQKKILDSAPVTATSLAPPTVPPIVDNSLLIVRYEKRVSPPDQPIRQRKRPAPQDDSDEELVIDNTREKFKKIGKIFCNYCNFEAQYPSKLRYHILRHFNLMPFSCCYCKSSGGKATIIDHTKMLHPNKPLCINVTAIPPAKATVIYPKRADKMLVCLYCLILLPEVEVKKHLHGDIRPDFARKDAVVCKCRICSVLRSGVTSLKKHHLSAHPGVPIDYTFFRLKCDSKDIFNCVYCRCKGFHLLTDLKNHHITVHPNIIFKY